MLPAQKRLKLTKYTNDMLLLKDLNLMPLYAEDDIRVLAIIFKVKLDSCTPCTLEAIEESYNRLLLQYAPSQHPSATSAQIIKLNEELKKLPLMKDRLIAECIKSKATLKNKQDEDSLKRQTSSSCGTILNMLQQAPVVAQVRAEQANAEYLENDLDEAHVGPSEAPVGPSFNPSCQPALGFR